LSLKQRLDDEFAGHPKLKSALEGLLDTVYLSSGGEADFPDYRWMGIKFNLTDAGVKFYSLKALVITKHHLNIAWSEDVIMHIEVGFSKCHWQGHFGEWYWFDIINADGERKRRFPEGEYLERFKQKYDWLVEYAIEHLD